VGIEFPVRALASFDRVWIEAGGTRQVRLQVPPDRLRYWSLADNAWRDASAGRSVYVGASSRELPLSSAIDRASTARRQLMPGSLPRNIAR
jgi:beta-glucosidase